MELERHGITPERGPIVVTGRGGGVGSVSKLGLQVIGRPGGTRKSPTFVASALLGIDSVMCPQSVCREAWKRLATDLDRGKLQTMTNEIQLPGVLVAAPAILDGRIRGRIVVKIG